jgi:hypothetical protein
MEAGASYFGWKTISSLRTITIGSSTILLAAEYALDSRNS